MFFGIFATGVITGAVAVCGGKRILKIVKQNDELMKQVHELKEEVKELKDEARGKKIGFDQNG